MDRESALREGTSTPDPSSSDQNTKVYHPVDVPVRRPDPEEYRKVPGWGIDADPENDPTYPMKPNRTDDEQKGYTWPRPPQQPVTMEVLHSIERPNISAVYGEAAPPFGVSGMLRRFAYHYSESSLARWLPVALADRVNVWEGYLDDLAHGYIPNCFAERGWGAEWRHDPNRVVRKVAIGTAAAAVVVTMICRTRNQR